MALLQLGMRQALVDSESLFFKACRIGISQLNQAGQIAIKRLLEIITVSSTDVLVPRPPEDAQLSASDTKDRLPELITP